MTIANIKNTLNAVTSLIAEKHGLEWLRFTVSLESEKKGYIKCEVYLSAYETGLRSGIIYLAEETNESDLVKAFDLFVEGMTKGVRV